MQANNHTDTDLESIAAALALFVRQNKDDALMRELSVTEDVVRGRRVRERVDLWFVGDWVVQGTGPLREASLSHEIAPGETVRLIVSMENREGTYVVTDWKMEQTF